MTSEHSRLTFLMERFGFNRFVLGLLLFFGAATLTVNVVPLVYKELTYETNANRLGVVIQRGDPELRARAQQLIDQEKFVLDRSDYSWLQESRGLYNLHKDNPELFAVNNDWLVAVANSSYFSHGDLLNLQAMAQSSSFLSTTQATDWLLSVLDKQGVSDSQALGLSALNERIVTGLTKPVPPEGQTPLPSSSGVQSSDD